MKREISKGLREIQAYKVRLKKRLMIRTAVKLKRKETEKGKGQVETIIEMNIILMNLQKEYDAIVDLQLYKYGYETIKNNEEDWVEDIAELLVSEFI